MRKMETTGNLDFLRKKYSGSQTCKPPMKEKPLGYEKLSFLFVMLIFGCIMSILVVFLEYMTLTKKKKQELSSKDKEIEEIYMNNYSLYQDLINDRNGTVEAISIRDFINMYEQEQNDIELTPDDDCYKNTYDPYDFF